jgi:hypothetical protein
MREISSEKRAKGSLAMMPIMMISEMPLPSPLSVIFSPSHMMNREPAVRMITDEMPKNEKIEWPVTFGSNGEIASGGSWDTRLAM